MKRIAGYLLLTVLLFVPAHAAGPLAFMAKDFVKGIVRSFIEGGLNKMLETAGPCGLPLAPPGGGVADMLRGRGAIPGMPSMPSAVGMGRGLPSVPGMGGGAVPPGMDRMMKEQMAQAQAQMAKEQGNESNLGQMPGAMPDMAAAMKAMQDAEPLSTAEADELGTLMERMRTAMPSAAPQCKPGEMKAAIQQAADSPMAGGVLRIMLGAMRDMQQKLDGARDTFANMSEPERAEAVELMAAEYRGWDQDSKQAMLGMVETNFLGMPDAMTTQLLARLKQVR